MNLVESGLSGEEPPQPTCTWGNGGSIVLMVPPERKFGGSTRSEVPSFHRCNSVCFNGSSSDGFVGFDGSVAERSVPFAGFVVAWLPLCSNTPMLYGSRQGMHLCTHLCGSTIASVSSAVIHERSKDNRSFIHISVTMVTVLVNK